MSTPGPFSGQTVLITGASRGIGAHLVEHFTARGAFVAACARSLSPEETEHTALASVDVTDEAAVQAWVSEVARRRGRLDVLINNAGAARMNPALLTPAQGLRDAFELNCLAAFTTSRAAVKWMRKTGGGRIINLTTVAVPLLIEGELAYAASKAALETATRLMAKEFAVYGVTCTLVGPSPVMTDLIKGLPKDKLNALLARLPLGKMAEVEDVAYAIEVFAASGARQLTGQVLYLGGAW